jgi:hypothetical protein
MIESAYGKPYQPSSETPKTLSYLPESPFHQYEMPERIGPGKSISRIMAEQENRKRRAEAKEAGQTKAEKKVSLDVYLNGDNLRYDVDTFYNALMEKMQSEKLLSAEGEM